MAAKWSSNWQDEGLTKKEKEMAVQLARFTAPIINKSKKSQENPNKQAFNIR